jgi:hypothetical protein
MLCCGDAPLAVYRARRYWILPSLPYSVWERRDYTDKPRVCPTVQPAYVRVARVRAPLEQVECGQAPISAFVAQSPFDIGDRLP